MSHGDAIASTTAVEIAVVRKFVSTVLEYVVACRLCHFLSASHCIGLFFSEHRCDDFDIFRRIFSNKAEGRPAILPVCRIAWCVRRAQRANGCTRTVVHCRENEKRGESAADAVRQISSLREFYRACAYHRIAIDSPPVECICNE